MPIFSCLFSHKVPKFSNFKPPIVHPLKIIYHHFAETLTFHAAKVLFFFELCKKNRNKVKNDNYKLAKWGKGLLFTVYCLLFTVYRLLFTVYELMCVL